jgi:hypothetical protein
MQFCSDAGLQAAYGILYTLLFTFNVDILIGATLFISNM